MLLEQFVLFDPFNRNFHLFATMVADTPFLDIPKPFCSIAIGICAECFKNSEPTATVSTSWRHFSSSPLQQLIETTQFNLHNIKNTVNTHAQGPA
jgi:hypothetical protein